MNPIYTRTIIDIYHGDTVDLALLANNGVVGCIMKATQGAGYIDKTFLARRSQAESLGLLTGSYHFATGEDVELQVENWLLMAQPKDNEVMEFDWEPNPGGSSMTYEQACEFVSEVFRHTGRFPLLYGSSYLNELIPAAEDSILFKCPLSLASYNAVPKIPRGWDHYTLWQYTGDDQNQKINPHWFPGAGNALDVYQFDGALADLRAQWPFVRS